MTKLLVETRKKFIKIYKRGSLQEIIYSGCIYYKEGIC